MSILKTDKMRPLFQEVTVALKVVNFPSKKVPNHTIVSLPYPIYLGGKMKSKAFQKSEVVNLRCQKVGQYCRYGLKY